MYQLLPGANIKHHQVVANMKKFAAHFKYGLTRVIADDKCLGQAPGSLSNVETHKLSCSFFRL